MEAAMKISTEATFSLIDQPVGWSGLNHAFSDWWHAQRLRHELESLDDCILRDMGLDPGEHRIETSKPFWMN
jgi:uncharacterized protein YjiS (DUF1127 family)